MRAVQKVSGHFEYLEKTGRVALCNMATNQRPYCASVNSHFPVGLVSRQ